MNPLDRHLDYLDRIAAIAEALGTGSAKPITRRLEDDEGAAVALIVNDILVSARVSGGKSAGRFLAAGDLKSLWPSDFVAITGALYLRAWEVWELLWIGKHPERADEWETGEDFDLMPVWRERVRRMLAKYRMAYVLDMGPQAYTDKLVADGLDQDTAISFAEILFDVEWETAPAE